MRAGCTLCSDKEQHWQGACTQASNVRVTDCESQEVESFSTFDRQHPTPARLPCGAGCHTRVHPRVRVLLDSSQHVRQTN